MTEGERGGCGEEECGGKGKTVDILISHRGH